MLTRASKTAALVNRFSTQRLFASVSTRALPQFDVEDESDAIEVGKTRKAFESLDHSKTIAQKANLAAQRVRSRREEASSSVSSKYELDFEDESDALELSKIGHANDDAHLNHLASFSERANAEARRLNQSKGRERRFTLRAMPSVFDHLHSRAMFDTIEQRAHLQLEAIRLKRRLRFRHSFPFKSNPDHFST